LKRSYTGSNPTLKFNDVLAVYASQPTEAGVENSEKVYNNVSEPLLVAASTFLS